MTTVGEKYFVEHCLEELDRLDDDGLVITRDGVPYAKVVRLDPAEHRPRNLRHLKGSLKGKIQIVGDIEGPVHPWDPDKYVNR